MLIAVAIAAIALTALSANHKDRFFDDVKLNDAIGKNVTQLTDPNDPSDGVVISVFGLPNHKAFSTDDRCIWLPRYYRPEKPEQVEVTIYTKDGRKWIARWEESK